MAMALYIRSSKTVSDGEHDMVFYFKSSSFQMITVHGVHADCIPYNDVGQ